MANFNTDGDETKVVMSVQEFDRFREIERAIKERKVYRIWKHNGSYGQDLQFSCVDENEVIDELTVRIHELTHEIFEYKNKERGK